MRLLSLLFCVVLSSIIVSCATTNDHDSSHGMTSTTYQPTAPTQQEQHIERMQRSIYQ